MLLKFRARENLGLKSAALDVPAGQKLHRPFRAYDSFAAKVAGVVTVEPAGQQELEQQAVVIKRGRRPQYPAVEEGAIEPNVAAGEDDSARVLGIVRVSRRRRQQQHAAKAQDRGDGRHRVNAPSPRHPGY